MPRRVAAPKTTPVRSDNSSSRALGAGPRGAPPGLYADPCGQLAARASGVHRVHHIIARVTAHMAGERDHSCCTGRVGAETVTAPLLQSSMRKRAGAYTSYPGHSGYVRVLHDYYREPGWAVDPVFKVERFTGRIFDPCCGGFTIPARCRAHGYQADGSDLQDIAGCKVQDVFDITETHDNFFLNPPYRRAEAIIRHLLPLTHYKLVVFLRTNFLHGSKRHRLFFPVVPLARVWFLGPRPSCPPGVYRGQRDNLGCLIQPEETGGKMDYSWFIFERGHTGPWTGRPLS
jgi:hypothetical protein